MKAKEIFLLIFIILVGVTITQISTGKFDLGLEWGDNILFGYDEFVFEETEEIDSSLLNELRIRNSHGSIEIFGADVNNITISFKKRIWRKDEADAQDVADLLQMNIEQNGSTVNISTNRQEFRRKRFETDFIITVPEKLDVTVINAYGLVRTENVRHTDITNRYGEVYASDIAGELRISNSYDDIEIEQVDSICAIDGHHANITISNTGGAIDIKNSHGRIVLEGITNDITIRAPYCTIDGWDISGMMDIENSYDKIELTDIGPAKITANQSLIDIDGAKGNIDISNRYEKVQLNGIEGNVSINGKNLGISGDDIHGDTITISSSYQDIELDNFSGKTSISLSHGDLHLSPSPLTQSLEIKCSHVDIKFFWPENERFPLEAQAEQGEIQWKLDADIDYQKDNGLSILKAFSEEADKPSVFLSTTFGTIWIEESIIL